MSFSLALKRIKGAVSSDNRPSTFTARTDDLIVTVTEGGSIKARNTIEVKCEVDERQMTILDIVPEGTTITEEDFENGKVLVTLESSTIKDQLTQREMEFASAEARLAQAQEALYTIIPQLNQNDRFSLVFFAGEEFSQFPTDNNLLTATPEHIADGLKFVESIEASGGTNIDEALQISLNRIPRSDRLKLIIFLTDGLTRKGETDPYKIVENISDANIEKNVQIYSFGFAWELNMNL